MLQRVAEAAANRLTPVETHSICVLLSMAFGTGTMQSRIFAQHVNAVRRKLGLPQVTQAAAGNPTTGEKVNILRAAVGKLGDDAQALLLGVLLHSPLYGSAQSSQSDEEGTTILFPHDDGSQLPVLHDASVNSSRRVTMYTPILSERQKHRMLPVLLEVEELHLAQCVCPEKCQMLRRLREDITELRAMLSKPPRKQCREQRRIYPPPKESR